MSPSSSPSLPPSSDLSPPSFPSPQMPLLSLPPEMLQEIFRHLNRYDIQAIRLTCHRACKIFRTIPFIFTDGIDFQGLSIFHTETRWDFIIVTGKKQINKALRRTDTLLFGSAARLNTCVRDMIAMEIPLDRKIFLSMSKSSYVHGGDIHNIYDQIDLPTYIERLRKEGKRINLYSEPGSFEEIVYLTPYDRLDVDHWTIGRVDGLRMLNGVMRCLGDVEVIGETLVYATSIPSGEISHFATMCQANAFFLDATSTTVIASTEKRLTLIIEEEEELHSSEGEDLLSDDDYDAVINARMW